MTIEQLKERFLASLKERLQPLVKRVSEADAWLKREQQKLAEASSAREATLQRNRERIRKGEVHADDAHVFDENTKVQEAEGGARYSKNRAEQAVREVSADRAAAVTLQALLDAEPRLSAALARAQTNLELRDSAAAAHKAAEGALASIQSMVDDETRSHAASRSGAAAALLAAVKRGDAGEKVAAASRDKLDTLELARASAEQELAACKAALDAASAGLAAATTELRQAQGAVDELTRQIAKDAGEQARAAAEAKARRELVTDDYTAASQLLTKV